MLIRNGTDQYAVIDFRETAAASAHRNMFNKNLTLATDSTLGMGVPGEIRGFAVAHAKYGKLPWATLFEPTIKLLRDGFPVTRKIHEMISVRRLVSFLILKRFKGKLLRSEGMRLAYFHKDGRPKEVGDYIYRRNLAETLEKIANQGPDIFYTGDIGHQIIGTVQSLEGGITLDDMMKYEAKIRDPLIAEIAGFKVITAGPPTCGPLILQILRVAEKLKLGKIEDVRTVQKIIETFKFAYVDRMKLGDPDFVENMDDVVADIISDQRADEIRPRINSTRTFSPEYYLGKNIFVDDESHGTTNLSTLDGDGNAVSLISTVNLEWGGRWLDTKTGVIFNNQLDDFSIPRTNNSFGLPPSEANYIMPFKRPLSSATPVILEKDGKVYMVLGGAGGSRIITAVAEMIIKVALLKMDPDEAMKSCRLHHQLLPDILLAEHRCDASLLKKLSHIGHAIVILGAEQTGTSVNMVLRNEDGGIVPISDLRKGGVAAGF